jgi:HEAT repeat protein
MSSSEVKRAEEAIAWLDHAVEETVALEPIERELESDTPRVRSRAIELAARFIEPEQLGRWVADPARASLRNSALEAMIMQGKEAFACLSDMCRSEDPDSVMFAVQVLGKLDDDDVRAMLLTLIDHPEENVKLTVIEALGELRAVAAVPQLSSLIGEDLWRSYAAIRSLGAIGAKEAEGEILAASRNELLQEVAIDALGRLGTEDCMKRLLELFEEQDDLSLRRKIIGSLGRSVDGGQSVLRLHHVASSQPAASAIDLTIEEALETGTSEEALAASILAIAWGHSKQFPAMIVRVLDAEENTWSRDLFETFETALAEYRLDWLHHPDANVRRAALIVSNTSADVEGTWIELLYDPCEYVRQEACRALGRCGGKVAATALLNELVARHVSETDLRKDFVDALAMRRPEELMDLSGLLRENATESQTIDALRIVERSGHAIHPAAVLKTLESECSEVRVAAIRTLAALGDSGSIERVIPCLNDPDEVVRSEAISALVTLRGTECTDLLLPFLQAVSPLRYEVIRALGKLEIGAAAEPLRDLYPDAQHHEALEIVTAIARIGPDWAVEFLEEQFVNGDVDLRRVAARGRLSHVSTADLSGFEAMAKDEDWSIRCMAVLGFVEIGTPGAIDALQRLSRDVESIVSKTANRALETLHAD